mgnify:CR=1 FL=1
MDRGGIVEFGGKRVSHWLPWHFDHCYNDELNRAGILRSAKVSPTGGITGFLDGIALYKRFPKDLLAKIEGRNPAYSVKCRIGAAMIWDAEKRGQLKPGVAVVERPVSNREFKADKLEVALQSDEPEVQAAQQQPAEDQPATADATAPAKPLQLAYAADDLPVAAIPEAAASEPSVAAPKAVTKLPPVIATTTSRPITWRFIWASALSSPVRLWR